MDINELRNRINIIDNQMSELFCERLKIAAGIAEYKRENSLPVYDKNREVSHLTEIKENTDEKFVSYNMQFFQNMMDISKSYQIAKNGKFGLLGENLVHSYSPEIHEMFGGYKYELFEISKDKVEGFLKERDFDAINVTIPYKKTVLKLCDRLDFTAEKIGSVNTIVKEADGKLKGYNTDYYGFSYLIQRSGVCVKNKKCLILGNGGVSPTIKTVLEDLGAGKIVTISRKGEFNYDDLYLFNDFEVIVNATPVGMYPNNGNVLVDLTKFEKLAGVFDVVYNPNKTQLILDAEQKNIPCCGGLPMLVAQAKRACEIFTGINIDNILLEDVVFKIESRMKNIALIGMPGCGKSTCGRELEKFTGRKLVDVDTAITEKIGCTIPEFFAEYGEEAFRKVETEVLSDISKNSGIIIATGGGVVTRKENYKLLHQNSNIVFLDREDIGSLSTIGRPVSQAKTTQKLAEERMPMYISWSDVRIKCINAKENAINIIKELNL